MTPAEQDAFHLDSAAAYITERSAGTHAVWELLWLAWYVERKGKHPNLLTALRSRRAATTERALTRGADAMPPRRAEATRALPSQVGRSQEARIEVS